MKLPSIVDDSDSDTEDGEVELFMPSQANKTAADVDYAQYFDPEHLNDALGSPTFHGTSMPYPPLPEVRLPGFHAADMRASDQPSTTATPVEAAAQPTEAEAANSAAAATDHIGTRRAAMSPDSAASGPAPESTAASTSAGTAPPPAQAAAPLLVDPGLPPSAAPAQAPPPVAAAAEVHVLSAPTILEDLDLDALLNRLSRTAVATGATAAPHAPPVSIVADSRFIESPGKPSAVAAQPAANCAAADGDQIVSPVYQPRWAKEAHGSIATTGLVHRSGYQLTPASQAGRLVSQYAGPKGSSSSSSRSSGSSSTSDSLNKPRLWAETRPVIKVDLRSDTRDLIPGAGAAASSMQMPPRFGFGRAGRGAGGAAVGATQSGAPAAAAEPLAAASATSAATVEADISDWWEGGAGGKQQHSESSDSEEEWLQFRQQHCKHRISQQQQ